MDARRKMDNDPAAASDDATFFSDIYARYGPIILHRCQQILRNEADARDALHDIFVKLMDQRHRYNGQRALLPWVLTISTNHCIDRLRQRRPQSPLIPEEQPASAVDAEVALANRDILERLLSRTDRKTQQMLVYHFIDRFPQNEIAGLLGCSEKTVNRCLARFRAQAKKWLERSE
jgi:RNA polymerase sigma-70 factor (ECF subfamily)